MDIKIIKHAVLDNIPSGSGIELVNGVIYIIGDDSEYLYGLNHELRVIHQVMEKLSGLAILLMRLVNVCSVSKIGGNS